uniref:LOW QUALITY PROTEIN: pentatricopeptide repeat-containing protein At4g25270, chloroplastic-like n=1 Tax=Elaeis guineensis var. tenera TaxID=51953 RepID=A0A6I9S678_ELAGV|nr:LOW QUALITY PROTEIN: pentatricopeptide repeat-containing protein At4g25270, chloroplastic-like [Elaeis guineensis]
MELHAGVLPASFASFLLVRGSSRRRKRERGEPPPKLVPKRINTLAYPKSSPTPLLLAPHRAPLTRDQALDRILADLDSALARGVHVEASIFASLLEACSQMRSLRHGVRLRRLIPPALLHRNPELSARLLRFYASCGRVDKAHQLFDQMPRRFKNSAFPWNSLISGYTELGLYEDAMALYYQMEEEGVEPDRFTFPRVLKACAGIGSVSHGEAIHRHIVRSGFGTDIFVLNALVDMYSKCGDIQKARQIFDKIPDRDPVSWNSMIKGYIRHELPLEALDICRRMLADGIEPDSITISSMLSGFSLPSTNKLGLQIHGWVLRHGLEWNLSVANSLVGMYSEHNQLDRARSIFESMPEKDLVSWNAIIHAHRRDHRVLTMFQSMEDSGVLPDQVTFVSLLSACANLGLVEDGRRLFSEMEERYKITRGMEHYGCTVNMLGRAGLVGEAYELISKQMPFDGGPTVWGALLYACSVHGNDDIGEIAAERLFELEPDNELNFELLMKIYRQAGRLEELEKVRMLMRERGLESES